MLVCVKWTDGNEQYECLCPGTRSAWNIYWALKQTYKEYRPLNDCYMWVTTGTVLLDPEQGNDCPPKKINEPTILREAVK